MIASAQVVPAGKHAPANANLARNARIAARLSEAADLLTAQKADPFRIAAYRKAALTIELLDRDLAEIEQEGGREALEAIPGVGRAIARAITQILHTGRWRYLEQLRAKTSPEALFRAIPGIGPELAKRLHEEVGVDTLAALETAAHQGRLASVPGIGHRRVALIRNALAEMLGRVRPRSAYRQPEPDVATLIDVDREYREKVLADSLPKIAPRRFNPTREAWLPVMRTTRKPWEFTALFSNTARAHELGKIKDWVVIYFHQPGKGEMQRTIVTEKRGALGQKRVVRGREADCRAYYGVNNQRRSH
jgi:DNA polymerase (family X)